ncbi:MAG: LysR family transcriptional regulator [Gammaproteobacteria bacterium]|nr:LysR family transcriptional regulator [Gammaproteobacteria bacterium]
MNWDDMRVLEACSRAGSFAKAAKELKMNHSSVSRRMTQLEKDLGIALFYRTSSGVRLTNAGQVVSLQASNMSSAALIAQNTSQTKGELSGKIRFQTVDATAFNLMGYLREFAQRYPAIEIDLVLSQGLANLARGEADVVLRATNKPTETYIGQQVAQHALAVFGTSEILNDYGSNTPLCDLPWVLWEDGLTDGWMEKHVPNASVAMRVNTAFGMTRAVRSGLGIGHLACYGVTRDEKFLCLRGPDPELSIQIWLLAHRNVRRNTKVRVFMAFLREKILKDRPLIEGMLGNVRHPLDIPIERRPVGSQNHVGNSQ